ncbi:MAG: DUF2213 domain-containing protein [Treponema sp.]|nr:DUF2213 domain-containing protein [Treponema sp.]
MGTPKTVKRFDTLDAGRWMTTPFTRTTEGFLTGRAIVTSIGVFTYKYADGTELRELRLPEEVFDPESLNSMKLKPVTNQHPDGFVTPENQQELQVGSLGSDVTTTTQYRDCDGWTEQEKITDGIHVAIDMTINRADAIDDVLNGRRALSMGYTCEIEETSGVYMGVEYDCIQRKIRYNHCAIVDAARAGDAAQIHLDSADAVLAGVPAIKSTHKDHQGQEDKSMKKTVRIDGVDVEVEDSVASHIAALNKKADEAEKRADGLEKEVADSKAAVSKLEAERDTEKARADKAEADLETARKDAMDDARIDAAVQERLAVFDAADKAGVKVEKEMKLDDIRREVIKATFPTISLDGKGADYVSACFDSAVAELERRGDSAQRIVGADGIGGTQDNYDSAAARQRMIDYNQRRSRGEEA